jgi:hypothetical protein
MHAYIRHIRHYKYYKQTARSSVFFCHWHLKMELRVQASCWNLVEVTSLIRWNRKVYSHGSIFEIVYQYCNMTALSVDIYILPIFMLPENFFGGAYSRQVVCPSVRTYVPNSCPAHNFVSWSRILKIFHINDHHIETTCRTQHLGRYLEGQGHGMTLQHNHVRPITLLFEVGF